MAATEPPLSPRPPQRCVAHVVTSPSAVCPHCAGLTVRACPPCPSFVAWSCFTLWTSRAGQSAPSLGHARSPLHKFSFQNRRPYVGGSPQTSFA